MLLGVAASDAKIDADYLAEKIAGLRIFEGNSCYTVTSAEVSGLPLMTPHAPSAPVTLRVLRYADSPAPSALRDWTVPSHDGGVPRVTVLLDSFKAF